MAGLGHSPSFTEGLITTVALSTAQKIYYAYEKAPFFSKYFKYIEKIFNEKDDYLIRLNLKLIFFILEELNIKTKMSLRPSIGISRNRKHRLWIR